MIRVLLIAFVVMAACVVLHSTALVTLGELLASRRETFQQKRSLFRETLRETFVVTTVFAIIITLHLIETALWALFYWGLDLFADFETCLYFSLISYTTIGFGDVVMPERWRLLGEIEGLSGVLLSGLSTAFVFVIINALLQ